MTTIRELTFCSDDEGRLSLPLRCMLDSSCFQSPEVQEAVAIVLKETLYIAAYAGIDLKALDGITVALDCQAAASAIQNLPEGQVPLVVSPQPESMEMVRTAAVRRDRDLRFHIVVRPGVCLMALSPQKEMRRLAQACIAHEAAHVEHESHLYRMFPESYGKPLECGNRSRKAYLKAMDVWSEYAACRSSAGFRPEAVEEFEGILCRAIKDSSDAAREQISAHRAGRSAAVVFRDVQQIFGDVFICAGYLLGHVHGIEGNLCDHAPQLHRLFERLPETGPLMSRLERILHELWLKEFVWDSIEVFAPIYDLISEMMALHGFVIAKTETEWRLIMSEDAGSADSIRDALILWVKDDR